MSRVALSVVGDVNEEAADGGGEILATNRTGKFETGSSKTTNANRRIFNACMKLVEDFAN